MFQRIKKGLEYLKLAVAQNLGEAQYNMATLYEQGIEIPQNVPKAIYYYKLAQTNIAQAQYSLGWKYYNGRFVKKEHDKATIFYN